MSADPNFVLDANTPPVEPEEEEKPDPVTLQSQIDELNRKLDYESKLRAAAEGQSEFWFNAANQKLPADSAPEPPPPAFSTAPMLDEDRYNKILSNPAEMQKYVDEVAEYKARIISREEAGAKADELKAEERRIQTAWAGEVKRLHDAGITGFGNTGDPLTDAFAAKVQAMLQDPAYKGIDAVVGMKLAIREAEAEYFRQNGAAQIPHIGEDDGQPGPTPVPSFPRQLSPQQQRNAAIAAQSPSKGRKPAAPDKFSNIPPEQLAMLQKHATGLGLPVEKLIEQMPRVIKFRQ